MTAKTDKDNTATDAKEAADALASKAIADKEVADESAKRMKELEQELAEANKKLAEKNKLEATAAKTLNKSVGINTGANNNATTIQCLLRRKGGTKVAFGNNEATKTTYHFEPISDDENAPHVCNVANDEHANRFLSITEAYRLYRGDGNAVDSIPVTKSNASNEDPFKNRFDDILSIDFETADNEVVTGWAKEILDLTISQAAAIRKKADNLNVSISKGDNMTEVLRNIGHAMQAEAKLASDQASKGK